jgi:peptidoglycan/LPS O-acetylase OafA/YrhL
LSACPTLALFLIAEYLKCVKADGVKKRFSYIDALRGYAVLGVLLVHVGQYTEFAAGLPAAGARGVQLFFVVSAMTLLMSWHKRNDSVVGFFTRRAFRILPMFWLAIPLYFVAGDNINQAIGAAFLLQATRPDWIFGLVPGGWSVCAEVGFYCLFPLLAGIITSLPRAFYFVFVSVVVSKLWRSVGVEAMAGIFPSASNLGTFMALTLPTQLPIFAAGMASYFLARRFANLPRLALESILLAATIGVGWYAAHRSEDYAAFGGLFAIGVTCMANGAGRYLLNPIIEHIGRCSFSIYLLHFKCAAWIAPLFKGMTPTAEFATLFFGTAVVTTALSSFTYYGIERPMIRFGNRLLGPDDEEPSTAQIIRIR